MFGNLVEVVAVVTVVTIAVAVNVVVVKILIDFLQKMRNFPLKSLDSL